MGCRIESQTSKLAKVRRGGLVALWASCNLPIATAQGVATSATAAWSSQIVAFWGAVGIGVRSSSWSQASNALTSSVAIVTLLTRTHAIVTSLSRSEWYLLAPGYHGGTTRLDVLLICWRTTRELESLAAKVAMIAETLGRSRWLMLVVGRKLETGGYLASPSGVYWTQSPRCQDFSVLRYTGNRTSFVAFSPQDLQTFVNLHQSGTTTINDIVTYINRTCNWTTANAVHFHEAPLKVQQAMTIGRHITSFQDANVICPYVGMEKGVGQYGTNRQAHVRCARWMYVMVHLTVAIAVGLMGAASGRALAVWLFAVRIIVRKLGAEAIPGDDMLLTLLSFEDLLYQYDGATAGNTTLPGDALLRGSSRWELAAAVAMNVAELLLVGGGWLYGALKVEKLPPQGLVGHGMLWLAVVVALGLSVRTVFGIRVRVKGRLIGLFKGQDYTHAMIAHDCKLAFKVPSPPSQPSTAAAPNAAASNAQSSSAPSAYIQLVSGIVSHVGDDRTCIKVALALMRQPSFCSDVQDYTTTQVLKYSYTNDTFAGMGNRNRKVTTAGAYPWVQALFSVALTVSCAVFAAVYTYWDLPSYAKLVAEVVLAVSAVLFATLDRTSRLPHNPSSYTCHMIATMVASAVWYVGVRDLG